MMLDFIQVIVNFLFIPTCSKSPADTIDLGEEADADISLEIPTWNLIGRLCILSAEYGRATEV